MKVFVTDESIRYIICKLSLFLCAVPHVLFYKWFVCHNNTLTEIKILQTTLRLAVMRPSGAVFSPTWQQ